jgi:hypothetical protein
MSGTNEKTSFLSFDLRGWQKTPTQLTFFLPNFTGIGALPERTNPFTNIRPFLSATEAHLAGPPEGPPA